MLHLALAVAAALSLPKYWTVHIDTPRRDGRAALERVHLDDATVRRDAFAARALERPPMMIFEAGGVYYSLRPRASLMEIETPSTLPEDFRKELQEKTAPISQRAHQTLVTHHNELWQTETGLTRLSSAAAPKFMRMRVDFVRPTRQAEYEAAMKLLCDECDKRGVRVMALYSAYGDGAYRYLFMSDTPIDVRRVGALAATRDVVAHARPDLTLTPSERWIP